MSSFADYARGINRVLQALLDGGLARVVQLKIEPRADRRGPISGVLAFENDAELHFREFIDVNQPDPRLMDAYH